MLDDSVSDRGILRSHHALDFALTADAGAPQWKTVAGVTTERDQRGGLSPSHRTEIRSRWNEAHLYLLFMCHYEQRYSKPDPITTAKTNRLWDWDVAEAFIGSDVTNIGRYKEFQVSPHGEWLDLDIDRTADPPTHDWQWSSGFQVAARIVATEKIWYGEMRIPMRAIDPRPPRIGNELRANFYRLQGPPPNRTHVAWQPTRSDTYHVPEAFGVLRLE